MLKIFTSTVTDGSMKPLDATDIAATTERRLTYLNNQGVSPDATTCVRLVYEGDNYCRYQSIDTAYMGDGITRDSSLVVDALVVTELGHALFLPLADCVGAVFHDATKDILMLSHLGRHNLEQDGGRRSVEYLVARHGVNPADLTVWLSPAADAQSYPLFSFAHRSLQEVAAQQIATAGVPVEAIAASPIDVASDTHYYSHSQFLKGNRATDGRFAVVAVME